MTSRSDKSDNDPEKNDASMAPVPCKTAIKGRGTLSNPDNRFQSTSTQAFADGWDSAPTDSPTLKTEVRAEFSKSIISTNRSPDISFDYSINPYRGCEHGCTYCYARPSHAYWDLSPGLDFETRIISRPNAPALLRQKLADPRYQAKPICIGANTDPYQPIESKLKITRGIIEVLAEFQHPFSIITKSDGILRDLDLLAPLAANQLCSVAVSVTTLNNALKRALEPRAPSGRARLNAVKNLASAGIPVTVMAAPMIPCINDHELERIMDEAKNAGARNARYILIRLPHEVSPLFREWLACHFPDRAKKVMNIIQQSRGGKDYRSQFGKRMVGEGQFAQLLNQRWRVKADKLGFTGDMHTLLDSGRFHRGRFHRGRFHRGRFHQDAPQPNQAQLSLF